jgi:hypothetical protein
VSSATNQAMVPQNVLDNLSKFISSFSDLPHPLLIAQKFCLKYNDYGKQFGLPVIVGIVEHLIKNDSEVLELVI